MYQVALRIPFSVQGVEVVMVGARVRKMLKLWRVFAAPSRMRMEGVWAWQVRWEEGSCWVELRRVSMKRDVFKVVFWPWSEGGMSSNSFAKGVAPTWSRKHVSQNVILVVSWGFLGRLQDLVPSATGVPSHAGWASLNLEAATNCAHPLPLAFLEYSARTRTRYWECM